MSQRTSLPASQVSPEAAAKMSAFHADVVREVETVIQRDPVVVLGMAGNPHVRNVRKALTDAKIAFTYLEYGSYFSDWKKRLAIKLWSGWATFPQVFVRGVLIGGEDLTRAAISDGSLGQRLAGSARAA